MKETRTQLARPHAREVVCAVCSSVLESLKVVWNTPALSFAVAGKFAFGFTSGCHSFLQPWLVTERGFSRGTAAVVHGTVQLTVGVFSTPCLGLLADIFAQKTGQPKITLVAGEVAFLKLPLALYLFCLADPSASSFWVIYGALVLVASVSAPVMASVQQLSPPRLRGAIIGLTLLVLYLPGIGCGNLVAGLMADELAETGHPQPYTTALAAVYGLGCTLQAVREHKEPTLPWLVFLGWRAFSLRSVSTADAAQVFYALTARRFKRDLRRVQATTHACGE